MLSNLFFLLSEVSTKVDLGGTSGSETAVKVVENTTKSEGGLFGGGNNIITIVIYCVFIFAIMYFLTIRPRKKEEAKMANERAALTEGDWIVLNNGMYGIVTEILADVFICEFGTNKTLRVPVLKSQVIKANAPNLSKTIPAAPEEPPKKKGLFSK